MFSRHKDKDVPGKKERKKVNYNDDDDNNGGDFSVLFVLILLSFLLSSCRETSSPVSMRRCCREPRLWPRWTL